MGLLDDVLKGVNKGLSKIQATSQDMMQTISLNNRISNLEAKKAAALTNIGRLVYDKYERGDQVTEELLQDKVREIVQWERDIDALKAELGGLKAQYDPNMSCSEKAEAMAGYTPTPGFNCPSCQAPANQEKLFCVSCGSSLKGS